MRRKNKIKTRLFVDEDAENEIYPMPLILSSILQFFYMGCACGM